MRAEMLSIRKSPIVVKRRQYNKNSARFFFSSPVSFSLFWNRVKNPIRVIADEIYICSSERYGVPSDLLSFCYKQDEEWSFLMPSGYVWVAGEISA